jgi:hypothetical protein
LKTRFQLSPFHCELFYGAEAGSSFNVQHSASITAVNLTSLRLHGDAVHTASPNSRDVCRAKRPNNANFSLALPDEAAIRELAHCRRATMIAVPAMVALS